MEKKNLLGIGPIIIAFGVIVFILGFILSFITFGNAFSSSNPFSFEFSPFKSVIIVIGSGFAVVFVGTIVSMIEQALKRNNFQTSSQLVDSSPIVIEPYNSEPATFISTSPWQGRDETDLMNVKNVYSENNERCLKDQSTQYQVNWQKMTQLIFKGSVSEEKCGICKLQLTFDDMVLQCPYCGNLFHDDHLIEWLSKNGTCPICKEIIDID